MPEGLTQAARVGIGVAVGMACVAIILFLGAVAGYMNVFMMIRSNTSSDKFQPLNSV